MSAKFAMVPNEAISDEELTPSEFKVLVALYSFRDKNFDTVFPKLEALAARAGYADKTQISKITTRLEAKGWLTKATKKSFHGPKVYRLSIPDRLVIAGARAQVEEKAQSGSSSQVGKNAQVGSSAQEKICTATGEVLQVGQITQVGKTAPPNLERMPNSQLGQTTQDDPEQTSREQTNEQSSVAYATAAKAATHVDNSLAALKAIYSAPDTDKSIFDAGVPWLVSHGNTEQGARAVLGMLVKKFGTGRALDALVTAMMCQPTDPKPYLLAVASKAGQEIPKDWVPPESVLAELAGLGVPDDVITKARDIFVIWLRENGVRHANFNGLFVAWCRRDWERAEGHRHAYLQRLAASAGLEYQQAWREPA